MTGLLLFHTLNVAMGWSSCWIIHANSIKDHTKFIYLPCFSFTSCRVCIWFMMDLRLGVSHTPEPLQNKRNQEFILCMTHSWGASRGINILTRTPPKKNILQNRTLKGKFQGQFTPQAKGHYLGGHLHPFCSTRGSHRLRWISLAPMLRAKATTASAAHSACDGHLQLPLWKTCYDLKTEVAATLTNQPIDARKNWNRCSNLWNKWLT